MARRVLLLASLLLLLLGCGGSEAEELATRRPGALLLDDSAGRPGGAFAAAPAAAAASGSSVPHTAVADSATPVAAAPRRRTVFTDALAESPSEKRSALEIIGDAARSGSCTAQVNCSIGEFCYLSHYCAPCSYIGPGVCDALGHDCCSAAFARQCPGDPYDCARYPPCAQQSDCAVGQYCSGTSDRCSECSRISPGYCDALGGDCCSAAFARQCPGDPLDCSGQSVLLRWIGVACGAVSGVWWLIRADRELLGERVAADFDCSAYCARTRSAAARWVAVLAAAVLIAVVLLDIGRVTVTRPLVQAAFWVAVAFLMFTVTEAWTSFVLSEPEPEPEPSPEPIAGRLTPGSRVWRGILLPALEAVLRLAVGPGVPAVCLTRFVSAPSFVSALSDASLHLPWYTAGA